MLSYLGDFSPLAVLFAASRARASVPRLRAASSTRLALLICSHRANEPKKKKKKGKKRKKKTTSRRALFHLARGCISVAHLVKYVSIETADIK